MRRSTAVTASTKARSLALSVHFKHPEFQMKEFEILSRASAFLLSVDPPEPTIEATSRYSHVVESKKKREDLLRKQDYNMKPAGGPPRHVKDLGWLEFCPGVFRPLAHVVAASHVLSPWQWKNYYPQPWLKHVTQDHVRYSVSVYDMENKDTSKVHEPLATFGLNPYPIHHNTMDLALIHLKSEEAALKQMQSLGVELLHLTENDRMFNRGDEVTFEGFELTDDHYDNLEKVNDEIESEREKKKSEEDIRVFVPYEIKGKLIFASAERFLAKTDTPLPEGVCGGPVIDSDGKVCGIVEGIVPVDHKEKDMAGAAAFIPYFRLREFINDAEKGMLQKIVPDTLFDKVVELKQGKSLNERNTSLNIAGDQSLKRDAEEGLNMDRLYEDMIESIRKSHSPEQVEAIIGTIEREQEEVLDIVEREGGDLDEIIARVRARTRQKQMEILKELEAADFEQAEIVSEEEHNDDNLAETKNDNK
jgi:hypothetical protein